MGAFPKWLLQTLAIYLLVGSVWGKAEIQRRQDGNGTGGADPLWNAYSQCKEQLGEKTLICDPQNALQGFGVKTQVDDILWRMQTEVPCYCVLEQDCNRYDDFPIQSGIVAALVAFAGADLPDDLDTIVGKIYDDAHLSSSMSTSNIDMVEEGGDPCDNGLLLVYALDTRSLYFYPGTALVSVFDHLLTHKRRIEPSALADYLDGMLGILQKRSPESVAIQHSPSPHRGWMGWEIVVGMIAAVIIVAITGAALLAIFFTGCFGVRPSKRIYNPYLDPDEACKRYEKECKDWTRRARHLAKQRAKMIRAMQKPDWPSKVASAKRRLSERKTSSVIALESLEKNETNDQVTMPYYIVSEPGTVYNNHFYNWMSYDDDTAQADNTPVGTVRSSRHGLGSATDGSRGRRETQRCDFYFQEEQ